MSLFNKSFDHLFNEPSLLKRSIHLAHINEPIIIILRTIHTLKNNPRAQSNREQNTLLL